MELRNYQPDVKQLTDEIKNLVEASKIEVYKKINNSIVLTYWEVGKRIATLERKKSFDNQSIRLLLTDLSKELTQKIGKGYNRSNLTYMRLFYLNYETGVTLSHQLSWSHYIELLKVDDQLERSFYKNQCINEKWSVRELRRQKDSALFQRLALSKDKKGILELAQKGQTIKTSSDLVKH